MAGRDIEALRAQLDSLRQRHQEVTKRRTQQYEAIRNLGVSPEEPRARPDSKSKAALSLVPPSEDFELKPSRVPVYTRFVQTDPLPEPEPVVIQSRPTVELAIDESSATYFEPTSSQTFARTEQLRAAVHSPSENSSLIPVDLNWSSSHCAVAYRHARPTQNGVLRIYDAGCPETPTQIPLTIQPSTVRFLPRSTDCLLVGSTTGSLLLLDRRRGADPVAETVRWKPSHFAQITATIFTATKRFLSVSSDGKMYSWDVDSFPSSAPSKTRLALVGSSEASRPSCACVNDHGGLVIGFEQGMVAIRPVEIRREEKQRPIILDVLRRDGGAVTALSFRETSHGWKSTLAVASLDGAVSLWSNDRCVRNIEYLAETVVGCCWKPGQVPILAICRSNAKIGFFDFEAEAETLIEWDAGDGKAVATCSEFTADGSIYCVGDTLGVVHLLRC